MIECRQGLLLSIPHYAGELTLFANTEPTKKRTFLVVDVDSETNEVAVISITSEKFDKRGKRGLFRSGYVSFYPHHPPF